MRNAILILLFVIITACTLGQTKHIGFWVQYVDYDGEYVNMIDALDSATFDYELHEYWDYTAITAESLNQIDVFIVPECEMSYSAGRAQGAALSSIISTWVNSGGLLIGFFRNGRDFITGAGFDSMGVTYTSTMYHDLTVVLPTHPIAEDVDSTFEGMNASYGYREYSAYTPVVLDNTVSPPTMHTGFIEIGAGCVVYFGGDYFETATPNQDRLFQNAVEYWGMRSEGPILREFFPPEGSIVSADTQVVLFFEDEDGVDLSSFQATVNGVVYTGSDPAVSLDGDSLIIDIPDTLPDGTVTVHIDNVEDPLGHIGPDTTRNYLFTIDQTPPVITYHEPEGVCTYTPSGALIRYYDEISGAESDDWYLFFEYVDTITEATSGVIMEGDSTAIIPFSLTGVVVTPGETLQVEFGVCDNPDIGEPNKGVYTWWFLDVTGIEENRLPEVTDLSIFPNPFNGACRIAAPPGAEISIFDIDGRSVFEMRMDPTDAVWQPNDNITSGMYLVKSKTENWTQTKRIIYIK